MIFMQNDLPEQNNNLIKNHEADAGQSRDAQHYDEALGIIMEYVEIE